MKKGYKLIAVLMSVIVMLISSPTGARAAEQIYYVQVAGVLQAKSGWCWAACAEMAGKNAYPSSTRNQYSVVNVLHGTPSNPYPNVGGTIGDSATGTQYVTYYNATYHATNSALTFLGLQSHLSNHNPVQAGAGYYYNGDRTGGHVVVIYETYSSTSTSGTIKEISYIDPLTNTRFTCTYSSFCNGSFNGRIYDQSIIRIN